MADSIAKKIELMDGNQAAAYISYAFTEVAGIFPITPSSPMACSDSPWRSSRCSPREAPPARFTALYSPAR